MMDLPEQSETVENTEDQPADLLPTDASPSQIDESTLNEPELEPSEEDSPVVPVPEPDDGRAWFVVHCY